MSELEKLQSQYNEMFHEFQSYKSGITTELKALKDENRKYKSLYEESLKNDPKASTNTNQATSQLPSNDMNFDNRYNNIIYRLDTLERQFSTLNHYITEEVKVQVNDLAQYQRKKGLVFHKVENLPDPDPDSITKTNIKFDEFMVQTINTILPNMERAIRIEDISTAHVLPTRNKRKDVVLVQFTNLRSRNMVFFSKSSLKNNENTKITISEHLTSANISLIRPILKNS